MENQMQNFSSDRNTPLSTEEVERFRVLKQTIRQNFKAFYEVGQALAEIKSQGYYINTHETFEAFVRDEFEIARRTAYQYIDAFHSYENICSARTDVLPANERQIRPLTLLPDPAAQVQVWHEVVETAPDGKVTGRHVAAVVRNFLGRELRQRTERMKNALDLTDTIPETFKDSYFSLLDVIRDARQSNFKGVDKEKMIHYLDGLRRLLED